MMITGDYQHTAISVAKDVGMLTPDSQVLVIDAAKEPQASPLQPSASANQSQASTDHPTAADTIPAYVHRSISTPVQLSHGSYTTNDCSSSQGDGPSYIHKQEQILEADADSSLTEHVAWSQERPLSRPDHAGSGQGYAVDVYSHAGDGHSHAWDGHSHATDGHSHAGDGQGQSQQSAGIPAHRGVLQSQVGVWTPPAGITPAGITSPEPQAASLRFVMGDNDEEWNAMQALTALAEGHVQCAVTGEAFQLLLQLPDVSALGAVMRNVVVFARMKPHQKGQVMDLLNARGLHQVHAGKPRHIQVYSNCTLPLQWLFPLQKPFPCQNMLNARNCIR